jgi:arsenite-transporting ATPase
MRLILYTGKGGVGKSSLAAATAVRAAELGRRTLLVSSDLAHNLSDIFEMRVGGGPRRIGENLDCLEIDTLGEIREHWGRAHDYFAGFLAYLGVQDAVAEEVALWPGTQEVFLLTRILAELESERYETVIVDCAPTGGTLRLLTLADTAGTKMNRVLNVERQILRLLRPVTNRFASMRAMVPSDEVYGVLETAIRQVGRLGQILKDPQVSSVRLVLNPDRIALAETRRAFTYFGLFGFPVDAILINKVLPEVLQAGYLHDWYGIQEELLAEIEHSFLDIAQLRVPLFDQEPMGPETLAQMARGFFSEVRPDDFLSRPRTVAWSREEGVDRLTFWLPSADRRQLDIGRKDGALLLTAGSYVRVFSLPDTLADREVTEARFDEGQLTISFAAARAEDAPCD